MALDFVIVGAGLSGCVVAERLNDKYPGSSILVVEKRPHIGGNCFDYFDKNGLVYHKYGPHFFHTDDKEVWDYLSRFTKWHYYQHRVLSFVDGQYLPFPPDDSTVAKHYTDIDKAYEEELIKQGMDQYSNSETYVRWMVGKYLYTKFYYGYTLKQWGIPPNLLDYKVCGRIPIRAEGDVRYFSDKYQGVPYSGYTAMMERMLFSSKKIHVLLNTSFRELAVDFVGENVPIIWTAPLDEYFGHSEGKLPYRSLQFVDRLIYGERFHQQAAQINYPNSYDFTRTIELSHVTLLDLPYTTISYEYPMEYTGENEPYYPIPCRESEIMCEKYWGHAGKLAKKVWFLGRLGKYQYINMDDAVREAINLVKQL